MNQKTAFRPVLRMQITFNNAIDSYIFNSNCSVSEF